MENRSGNMEFCYEDARIFCYEDRRHGGGLPLLKKLLPLFIVLMMTADWTCPALASTVFPSGAAVEVYSGASDTTYQDYSRYRMQKRFRPKHDVFLKDHFLDNLYLGAFFSEKKLFSSSYGLGPDIGGMIGKKFDPYNTLRFTGSAGFFYNNDNNSKIWNGEIHASHLFDLTSYLCGFRRNRFFTLSTVEGIGYTLSRNRGEFDHSFNMHLGLDFNFRLGKRIDIFADPMVLFYTGGIDRKSFTQSWRHHYLGYSVMAGCKYKFWGSLREEYRAERREEGHRSEWADKKMFVYVMGGFQFQNSDLVKDRVGIWPSIGPHAAAGYGVHFTRAFAFRASLFYSHHIWTRYPDWGSMKSRYAGGRVEAILDLVGLAPSCVDSPWAFSLVFGPEIGIVHKSDNGPDVDKPYIGICGGAQVKYTLRRRVGLFLEPRFSLAPYSFPFLIAEPNSYERQNFYDGLFNMNFGIEFNF